MSLADYMQKIRDLRDEITVEAFGGFGQSSREASLCLTKLDEAELWLQRHALASGRMLLIDKADYREGLEATKDVATDRTDNEGVNSGI